MRVRHVLLSAGGISLVSVTAGLLPSGVPRRLQERREAGRKPGAAAAPVTAAALAPVFGTLGPAGRRAAAAGHRAGAADRRREQRRGGSQQPRARASPCSRRSPANSAAPGPPPSSSSRRERFAAGTTYTATLVAVRTAEGKELRGPGGGWTYRFTTPGFALSRMSLVGTEAGGGKKDRSAPPPSTSSSPAPVELDSVRKRATFTVTDSYGRDAPLGVSAPQQQARQHRAGTASAARRCGPSARLRLTLAAGVEQDGGAGVAPAASDEATLPQGGDAVEIKAIFPAEATSGFYVEIVCDDSAAAGEDEGRLHGQRWYWDRVTQRGFGQLSQRCLYSGEELAEKLHITPAATFTTAPVRRRHAPVRRLQARPLLVPPRSRRAHRRRRCAAGRVRDQLLGAGALAAGDLRRQGALPAAQRLAVAAGAPPQRRRGDGRGAPGAAEEPRLLDEQRRERGGRRAHQRPRGPAQGAGARRPRQAGDHLRRRRLVGAGRHQGPPGDHPGQRRRPRHRAAAAHRPAAGGQAHRHGRR